MCLGIEYVDMSMSDSGRGVTYLVTLESAVQHMSNTYIMITDLVSYDYFVLI